MHNSYILKCLFSSSLFLFSSVPVLFPRIPLSSRLDNHLILCHNYKKDEFRCETCSQAFCYRPSLLRHKALQHGEVRRFPCENCSKVSSFFRFFCPHNICNFLPPHSCVQFYYSFWIFVTESYECGEFRNKSQKHTNECIIQNTAIIYSKCPIRQKVIIIRF